MKHTVLIADDHAVYRMGLRDLLEPEYRIVSEATGKAYLPPQIGKRVMNGVAGALGGRSDGADRTVTPLSNRELTVLRLMAEGKRNREIAKDLSLSERTVGNHITNIYNKLGIYDRTQAVVYAIKKGIVQI